jgi:hypothetical protein
MNVRIEPDQSHAFFVVVHRARRARHQSIDNDLVRRFDICFAFLVVSYQ